MRIKIGSCAYLSLIATVAALNAQSYSVLTLPPTPGVPVGTTTRAWSMNNRFQVLGEQTVPDWQLSFPVVWTGGVPANLPMPLAYVYSRLDSGWQINDDGLIMGFVVPRSDRNPARGRVALFKGSSSSILPHGPAGTGCGPAARSSGLGLNKAGHIIGESRDEFGCGGYWFWDGSTFSSLPAPPLPPVPPGCTPGSWFPHVAFTGAIKPINDADEIAGTVQVDNWFCPDPTAYFPFIYKPGVGYTLLPPPSGATYTYSTARNNRGETLGWYLASERFRALVWDSSGVRDLGPASYASLNDVGQILLRTSTGALQIWRNGNATPVELPPGIDPGAQLTVLNNAGQMAGTDPVLGPVLLTPRRPCAADITSQIGINASEIYFNPSTGRYVQLIKLTNNGTTALAAPISLVFDGLPAAATVFGIGGTRLCGTIGSPYINSAVSLAPGASTTLLVQFINTSGAPITYSNRIIAGIGGR